VNNIRLRYNHQAAGILIQTVHNPKPLLAAPLGQMVATMVKQGIHQRATRMSGSGVNDQTRLLV
jgi:hypothetical protein